MSDSEDIGWQRIDKWQGGLRINRQPTEKPHARLRVGDVITLPLRGRVRVLEVLALATRRGPASEAATLYREIPPADTLSCPGAESASYPLPASEP